MKLIRNNIFETNSSSTHCLVILDKENYKKWENHEVVLDLYQACNNPLNPIKELNPDINLVRNGDGSVEYNGKHYERMLDLMDDEYEVFDDDYATKEYIDEYAEVNSYELDGRVIMAVDREERW